MLATSEQNLMVMWMVSNYFFLLFAVSLQVKHWHVYWNRLTPAILSACVKLRGKKRFKCFKLENKLIQRYAAHIRWYEFVVVFFFCSQNKFTIFHLFHVDFCIFVMSESEIFSSCFLLPCYTHASRRDDGGRHNVIYTYVINDKRAPTFICDLKFYIPLFFSSAHQSKSLTQTSSSVGVSGDTQ